MQFASIEPHLDDGVVVGEGVKVVVEDSLGWRVRGIEGYKSAFSAVSTHDTLFYHAIRAPPPPTHVIHTTHLADDVEREPREPVLHLHGRASLRRNVQPGRARAHRVGLHWVSYGWFLSGF
jgi:hypothetical protein